MFNTSWVMQGCAFCLELKQALILANMNLPLDKKIWVHDIHLGDSSVSFMETKYPNGRYPLPVTVLDSKTNFKGNFKINRTILMSSSIKELDAPLLEALA